MPSPRLRATAAPAVLLAAALALTACATAAPAESQGAGATPDTASVPSAGPTAPAATSTPTPEPVADPTCDTIIGAQTIAAFDGAGLDAREEVFRIASTEYSDGLYCAWVDASLAADQAQIFGWAPLTPEEAHASQDELQSAGWVREQGADGVYVTENPDFAMITDDEGYGMTYLFGDGWVTVASTKQALLLIELPTA